MINLIDVAKVSCLFNNIWMLPHPLP